MRDFLRYRRITANMDGRFPDATPEECARADHVCIICREELAPGGRNKRLGCAHVFHLHCLRSWLERQQSCPICRASVAPPASTVASETTATVLSAGAVRASRVSTSACCMARS